MIGGGLSGSMVKALVQSGIWHCTNYTPAQVMRTGYMHSDALFQYKAGFKHDGNVQTLASALK